MQNQYEARYSRRTKQPKSGSTTRLAIFLFLLAVIGVLSVFSAIQYLTMQSLQQNLDSLENKLKNVEQENRKLEEQYNRLYEENEKLRKENKMMRSETVIEHGNRETNKVAITIDDGAGAVLINRTLDYLKEYDVQATLFPMGSWVEREPEVWRRAVEEGHELGNHTYSHPFLTRINEEKVQEELKGWQEAVSEALGYSYQTYFFRPPYGDGFYSNRSSYTARIKEIAAEQGMFTILWDVEVVYALRNQPYTPARITSHVLANARGGSIVLLHFSTADIDALPNILAGLRERGLEPCSLSELLLAEPQT